MVLGGNLNDSKGGEATVALYRAENPELTQWTYLGIVFQHLYHRSFNVLKLSSASKMAIIHSRTTTLGSSHPFISK